MFTEFMAAVKGLERPLPWAEWLRQRTDSPQWDAVLGEESLKIPWVAATSPFVTSVPDVQEVFGLDAPDPKAAYVEQQVRSAGVSEVLVINETWHSCEDLCDDVWRWATTPSASVTPAGASTDAAHFKSLACRSAGLAACSSAPDLCRQAARSRVEKSTSLSTGLNASGWWASSSVA